MMRMKKTVLLILTILTVCMCASALAEIWYVKTPNGKSVNIREAGSGKVIGQIPYGENIIPDPGKSTESSAYVTYYGVSGYVSWAYLVREKPEKFKKPASPKVEVTGDRVVYGEGEHSVSVTGGVLQFKNKKGKASGEKYNEVKFDDPVTLVVTASGTKKNKIDYWLINGVKIQLKAKSFTVIGETENIVIEVVYK